MIAHVECGSAGAAGDCAVGGTWCASFAVVSTTVCGAVGRWCWCCCDEWRVNAVVNDCVCHDSRSWLNSDCGGSSGSNEEGAGRKSVCGGRISIGSSAGRGGRGGNGGGDGGRVIGWGRGICRCRVSCGTAAIDCNIDVI